MSFEGPGRVASDVTDDAVRVWLVERTFSDDEQNVVILLYATPDGARVFRKERALTSFSGPARATHASTLADPENLDTVTDPGRRERFAAEARRMREEYDPDDPV